MSEATIRKGYCDGPFGQIHYRIAGEIGDKPDLYCLHPAPFSGLMYTLLMPHLAKGRRVIASDFPGCGQSDPYKAEPSIAEYAKSMAALIDDISVGSPVDLLGFHSGCLVATELALSAGEKIRKLALLDVPAFDAEKRAELLPVVAKPPEFSAELTSIEKQWKMGFLSRFDSLGADRAAEMLAEYLRTGTAAHATFHAAFSYDVEGQFAKLSHPISVIATQSGLLEPSRRAATLITDAQLIERLDVTGSVLEGSAENIAPTILDALA